MISDNIHQYDDVDAEVLRCYHEFTLANIIFYGMKESACAEQSSRMTAMDAASKNAGKFTHHWYQFMSLKAYSRDPILVGSENRIV